MGQLGDSSARVHTCRLSLNMAPFVKISLLLLLAEAALGARRLRNNRHLQDSAQTRDSRSLTNTFPFNAQVRRNEEHDGVHGEHHGEHNEHHAHAEDAPVSVSDLANRVSRQEDAGEVIDFPAVAAAGKKCIDKVEMVEETEYDDVVQCDHSYDRRCHTTYVTNYESQQEEECEEYFRKNCFIE